ncbi:unnamed protein product, partial [Brassica rapa]
LSCSDPVEAAFERQRILYSDANGLMEETAAAIMAASQVNVVNSVDSNPITPPPRQELPLNALLFHDPSVCYTPPVRPKEDTGLDPYYIDVSEENRNARIRSVIISPPTE